MLTSAKKRSCGESTVSWQLRSGEFQIADQQLRVCPLQTLCHWPGQFLMDDLFDPELHGDPMNESRGGMRQGTKTLWQNFQLGKP